MNGLLAYQGMMPQLGDDVFIAPGAWVIGDVVIGSRSSVWFNTLVRGDVHFIRIGSETNIQDNSTLHVTEGRFPLQMGDRITVGHRAIIHGCTIEDDCLIGMGAIVMDGVRVGRGSLVGAGAVITPGAVVPPDSLVLGFPARVVKTVGEAERRLIRESSLHYLDLARQYLGSDAPYDSRRACGFLDRV
ncbi:MAG: gamma carbonic anhydrase family protein [Syntrophobacteraceae bacterium]|jgi:carbonic anhydrase/acetyltransferase-like protein (isoleucine patch superfamily)|nr:gamma carbonic anhydrase family protein [Syntrophobacteraceae bacterium]